MIAALPLKSPTRGFTWAKATVSAIYISVFQAWNA